jgi:hypothetical protein
MILNKFKLYNSINISKLSRKLIKIPPTLIIITLKKSIQNTFNKNIHKNPSNFPTKKNPFLTSTSKNTNN